MKKSLRVNNIFFMTDILVFVKFGYIEKTQLSLDPKKYRYVIDIAKAIVQKENQSKGIEFLHHA